MNQSTEQLKTGLFMSDIHKILSDKRTEIHVFKVYGLVPSQLQPHMHICCRYRWNDMSSNEKVFIKDSTMNLLSSGTLDILQEEAHIKDALSRVVVEMIKREWPQQWPQLMDELNALCAIGVGSLILH